jgi:hypothetical protein
MSIIYKINLKWFYMVQGGTSVLVQNFGLYVDSREICPSSRDSKFQLLHCGAMSKISEARCQERDIYLRRKADAKFETAFGELHL